MPRKEEEKDEFQPAMSRREKRKTREIPKEPTPTTKMQKPDKIGRDDETKEESGPEANPRGEKSYAETASATTSSSSSKKNSTNPKNQEPKQKGKKGTSNPSESTTIVPSALPAVDSAAFSTAIVTDPTAAPMEETLPKLPTPSQTKKRKSSSGGVAEKAIDYDSMDRKVFGDVLKWKGVHVNGMVIRKGNGFLTMPRTKICGLDMVEALEDGTLVFPGSVPNFLPKTNISDIAEYIFEIYCHLRPDIFGSFEPLPDELQEGDEKKFTLDNQDQSRGEKLHRGCRALCNTTMRVNFHQSERKRIIQLQSLEEWSASQSMTEREAFKTRKYLCDLNSVGYENVFVGCFPDREAVLEVGPGNGKIYHLNENCAFVCEFRPAFNITTDWGKKDQLLLQYELDARFAGGVCRSIHGWA